MKRKKPPKTNNKALATLIIIIIMATATTLTTTATNNQNQQNNPTAREGAPTTSIYWARTYGGGGEDEPSCVRQTSDGGYIVAGYTTSFEAPGSGGYYHSHFWVLKLNSIGEITWQKIYGGSGNDFAQSVQQTTDGGYIVAGCTDSFGGGSQDVWVLKLNSTGGVTWQKTYGGSKYDVAYSVQQTTDGGYIVAGCTDSFGGGSQDVWVLKLNSTGGVTWQKTYGDAGNGGAYSVQQTTDGGYIVAGYQGSDFSVLKLNSTGDVTWQKTYGDNKIDVAYSVQQTSDGGYIISGYSGVTTQDIWVLKLSSTGDVTWQETYESTSGYSEPWTSIQQTSDGGYIVAGTTNSSSASSIGNFLVLKLNSSGGVTWQKTYGGDICDAAYSIQQTSDGGYIVAGITSSFCHGAGFWVLKLDSTASVIFNAGSGASTHTTSIVPYIPSVTISATSANATNSNATVEDTDVAPVNTNATVTTQANPGSTTPPGQATIIIILISGAAALVAVILIVVLLPKNRKPS